MVTARSVGTETLTLFSGAPRLAGLHGAMEDQIERRRRTLSDDYLQSAAARRLVAPTLRKLGDWQAEAVKLEVIARRPGSAISKPAVDRLLQDLQSEQLRLADCIAAADPALAAHSIVADCERSLASLAARVAALFAPAR